MSDIVNAYQKQFGSKPNVNQLIKFSKKSNKFKALTFIEAKKEISLAKNSKGKDKKNGKGKDNKKNVHKSKQKEQKEKKDKKEKKEKKQQKKEDSEPKEQTEQKEDIKTKTKAKAKYKINDNVLLTKDRMGIVRYVGEIKELGPHIYYGIELTNGVLGQSDGICKGKRYFETNGQRALFVTEEKIRREMTARDHQRKDSFVLSFQNKENLDKEEALSNSNSSSTKQIVDSSEHENDNENDNENDTGSEKNSEMIEEKEKEEETQKEQLDNTETINNGKEEKMEDSCENEEKETQNTEEKEQSQIIDNEQQVSKENIEISDNCNENEIEKGNENENEKEKEKEQENETKNENLNFEESKPEIEETIKETQIEENDIVESESKEQTLSNNTPKELEEKEFTDVPKPDYVSSVTSSSTKQENSLMDNQSTFTKVREEDSLFSFIWNQKEDIRGELLDIFCSPQLNPLMKDVFGGIKVTVNEHEQVKMWNQLIERWKKYV